MYCFRSINSLYSNIYIFNKIVNHFTENDDTKRVQQQYGGHRTHLAKPNENRNTEVLLPVVVGSVVGTLVVDGVVVGIVVVVATI